MPEPPREHSVGDHAPENGLRPLPERRAVSPRALVIAAGVGAAALVIGAYVAYRQLIHYERRAIEHVPAGAELALRLDLEQVVAFEPVRRHLLPLVDRAPLSDPQAQPASSRLLRLREAGLNLGMDLREAVFAREPGGGWALALGGIFGTQPLLPRIEAVLRAEPGARLRKQGSMLVFEPSAIALAQADDGILLVASDAALLGRALAPARVYEERLGLSRDGAAALGALGSWLRALDPSEPNASAAPSSLLRVSVRLDLGDPLELSAQVEHSGPVELATVRRELDLWLGTPTEGDFAPQADWGGERALSARAKLTRASPSRVDVHASWERTELDRAARSLATWLEARFGSSRPEAR